MTRPWCGLCWWPCPRHPVTSWAPVDGPLSAPPVLWLGCFPPGAEPVGNGVPVLARSGLQTAAPLRGRPFWRPSPLMSGLYCVSGWGPAWRPCWGRAEHFWSPSQHKACTSWEGRHGGRRCGPATPSLSFCLPRFPRLRHLSPRARKTISERACCPVGALTALGFGASWRTWGDETWAVEVSSGRDTAALAGEVASVCSAQTGRRWEAAPGECVHSPGAWRKASGLGGLEVDLGALWPCGGFGLVSFLALRQHGSGDFRWVFILGRISKIPHA